MIKIIRSCDKKSFLKNDDLYDTEVKERFKIVIFGVTIYSREAVFINEFEGKEQKKGAGFR